MADFSDNIWHTSVTSFVAKKEIFDETGSIQSNLLAPPESVTIERDTYGNVTSIIKESKTMTINYENDEVVSFSDNEYLWEIVKTDNIVTGVTVTKL